MSKILISKTHHSLVLFGIALLRTLVVTLFLTFSFLYCGALSLDQIAAASITVQHCLLNSEMVHMLCVKFL